MYAKFSSVHNRREEAVFDAVIEAAARFPDVSDDPDLLADVACVALNRLPPRYIRHAADYSFYLTSEDREISAGMVAEAVEAAFDFVRSRRQIRAGSAE